MQCVLFVQGEFNWSELEHDQISTGSPSSPAPEDHQEGAKIEGCV